MTGVNWGLVRNSQAGFQNALAMGMQMGAQVRQARDEREYRNALSTVLMPQQSGQGAPQVPAMGGGSGIVATPEQEAETARMEAMFPNAPKYAPEDERAAAMRVIAQRNPQLFAQMQEREAAQQQETVIADLSNRYLGGDAAAGEELARVNFPRWKDLSAEVKAKATQDANLFGSAALDILQVPPGQQRRDRVITYAQQFPQFAEQINEIAFLPPAEQETRLRAIVAQAGLIQKLHDMEKPQTLNVQPGAGVYERDPRTNEIRTIVQPNYGQAPSFAPVPQAGGGAPALSDIDAELRRRGVL